MVTKEGQPTGRRFRAHFLYLSFDGWWRWSRCMLYCRELYNLHGSGRDQKVVNPIEILGVIKTDFDLAASLTTHLHYSHLRA